MSFTNYYYVLEAFQSKDMQQAVFLMKSYLEKKLGVNLYQIFGIDYYKNNRVHGEGLRFILPDDRQVRFNFDHKEIISIDIWQTGHNDPDVTVETRGMSVVKILPLVADQLNNPKIGEFDIPQEEPELVTTEAVKPKLVQKVKVVPAGKNEVDNDPTLPPLQKEFDTMEYANIEYVFKDLDSLVELVAEGKSYSLLITGLPGTGKTYSVTNKLNQYGKEGNFYNHIQGITSPKGLYRILYEDNGKIIVFDDCDKVLKNEDMISILKAALDNKEQRRVSWAKESTYNPKGMPQEQIDALAQEGKLPNNFIFTGKIIFITNLYQDKVDTAIKSRSAHIDVTLRRKDIIARIRQIMDQIQPNIERKYKEELVNFFEKNLGKLHRDIDLRKFDIALRIIASGKNDWERLVSNYI